MNCFHAQARQYLFPSPTVCSWLGVIYAVFDQVYSIHVIVFNLQGITLDKSRKLLSNLSSNYSKTRMKYCVTLFFPNINNHENYLSISSVLFVNLHENSGMNFCNYFKIIYFDSPLGNSGVY